MSAGAKLLLRAVLGSGACASLLALRAAQRSEVPEAPMPQQVAPTYIFPGLHTGAHPFFSAPVSASLTSMVSTWVSRFAVHARPPAPALPSPHVKTLTPDELSYFPASSAPAAVLGRPPLPTLTSTLSLAEQAARLDTIAAYGLPSVENVVIRNGFISSANFRTRCPNWVAEDYSGKAFAEKRPAVPWGGKKGAAPKNDADTSAVPDASDADVDARARSNSSGSGSGDLIKIDRKTLSFRADAAVPPGFRSVPSDYARSGYARGHLAPAASHSYNELDSFETFLLSTNVVPQNSAMNSGDWLKLERLSRTLCQHFRHVRTVTGPLFLPNVDHATGKTVVKYEVIGKNEVAVPTHLFKVIYAEEPKSQEAIQSISNAFSHGIISSLARVTLPAPGAASAPAAKGGKGQVLPGQRQVLIAAFIMPNAEGTIERSLSSYMVTLSELERMSGLCLTPRTHPDSVTMSTVEFP